MSCKDQKQLVFPVPTGTKFHLTSDHVTTWVVVNVEADGVVYMTLPMRSRHMPVFFSADNQKMTDLRLHEAS